jgi:hypothetical protein
VRAPGLKPHLVKAAVEGHLPRGVGIERLRDLPCEWSRQSARDACAVAQGRLSLLLALGSRAHREGDRRSPPNCAD